MPCKQLETSVKRNSVDPSMLTTDHPSVVPTTACRTLRVLPGVLLMDRGSQSSRLQLFGIKFHFVYYCMSKKTDDFIVTENFCYHKSRSFLRNLVYERTPPSQHRGYLLLSRLSYTVSRIYTSTWHCIPTRLDPLNVVLEIPLHRLYIYGPGVGIPKTPIQTHLDS